MSSFLTDESVFHAYWIIELLLRVYWEKYNLLSWGLSSVKARRVLTAPHTPLKTVK